MSLKITSDENDELVIRSLPLMIWTVGIVFSGVGVFVLLDSPVMSLFFLGFGVMMVLINHWGTIRLSLREQVLSIQTRNLLGQTVDRAIPMKELRSVHLERDRTSKGAIVYGVEFETVHGERVPLVSYKSSNGGEEMATIVERSRRMLDRYHDEHPVKELPEESGGWIEPAPQVQPVENGAEFEETAPW